MIMAPGGKELFSHQYTKSGNGILTWASLYTPLFHLSAIAERSKNIAKNDFRNHVSLTEFIATTVSSAYPAR
jgi:hypothetical protein